MSIDEDLGVLTGTRLRLIDRIQSVQCVYNVLSLYPDKRKRLPLSFLRNGS